MMIRSTYYTSLLFLITIVVICNQNIFGNCIKTTPHVGQRPMGDRNFLGRKKTVPSTGASSIDRSISAHRYSPKVREKFNKKKEDRKRSMASLQSTQTYGLEDINCDAIGATGYACRNYMLAYLNDYVVKNGTYNPIQLPVPENSDIPQVELLVTFMDLLEIDVVTGTMTTSLFIDMFWTDEIIPEWNVSLTDGIDELVVPNGLLWEPDIQVYNSIGAYFDQIDSYAVFLYPDGLVWWSGRGMFTFSCEFDVTEFPFDSQSCQIQFASWIYSITSVNLSSVTMDINPGFSNLAWEVDSVTAAREVVIQWEVYAFPYGIYTINISRYSSHYVTTTIMPALIITVIVIIGLFIPNHASRLSLCVTGLLTIIAIQWSISAYIPVSDQTNWLTGFLLMNLSFVAACAAECYLSAMMAAVKHDDKVPPWLVVFIDISLCRMHTLRWWKHESAGPATDVEVSSSSPSVELNSLNNGAISSSGVEKAPGPDCHVDLDPVDEEKYTWSRGSRALDRMARLVIPLLYAIIIGVMFSDI